MRDRKVGVGCQVGGTWGSGKVLYQSLYMISVLQAAIFQVWQWSLSRNCFSRCGKREQCEFSSIIIGNTASKPK